MSDDDLIDIWNKTNGIASPLSTKAILAGMRAAAESERATCKASIDKLIKTGPLQGSGWDESAQRNGLILASNVLGAL